MVKPTPPPFGPGDPYVGIMYGYLYNWHAVDTGILAPTGWRVPSEIDFKNLTDWLNPLVDDEGRALKSTRTYGREGIGLHDHPYWLEHPRRFGTDEYNFSAVPGGRRSNEGAFTYVSSYGSWWTTTPSSVYPPTLARQFGLSFSSAAWTRTYGYMGGGRSVRCVRDAIPLEENLDDGTYRDDATDADGNTYKTVKIGTQVWMVQNLATTKYNDNSAIPNITDDGDWEEDTDGAYCAYHNLQAWAFTNTEWL